MGNVWNKLEFSISKAPQYRNNKISNTMEHEISI